jgi:hypothetical protein
MSMGSFDKGWHCNSFYIARNITLMLHEYFGHLSKVQFSWSSVSVYHEGNEAVT